MEEGTQSAWLYETLERHADEIMVASVPESRGHKNDSRDAYGLAEKLRIGAIDKSVFKAPVQFRRLREIARVHEMLVRDVVRVQARLESIYPSRGVTTPGATVYSVKKRHEWLGKLPPAGAYAASKLYEHYDALTAIKDQTTAELIAEAKLCPIVRILETAPGLGPIRVARMMPIRGAGARGGSRNWPLESPIPRSPLRAAVCAAWPRPVLAVERAEARLRRQGALRLQGRM